MTKTDNRTLKGSAVTRVLDILTAVSDAEQALTATELAAHLKIPKASAHRLCGTLEEHGFLQTRLNGRGLAAGPKLQRMALGVLASGDLQSDHRIVLARLSAEVGETCNLAIPNGVGMLYYDRVETHWPVRVQLQVGSRVPLHATASGKMYLSTLPVAKREQWVELLDRERFTKNTLVDRDALLNELKSVAANGFATDNEEYIDGMVALAVPVCDERGKLYATLSFHAPCMRVPFAALVDFLPSVKNASEDLTNIIKSLP